LSCLINPLVEKCSDVEGRQKAEARKKNFWTHAFMLMKDLKIPALERLKNEIDRIKKNTGISVRNH